MTSIDPALAAMTRKFLDTILPTARDGFLIVAIGHGPHYDASGKYTHTSWIERPVPWPFGADAAVDLIQTHAPTCDVYVCPYLMKTPERKKGNAAYRALVHCDVDGQFDITKTHRFDDVTIVSSGTPGHAHVYIVLDWPVMPAQHDVLERRLVAHLGGDPGKISENDVLRPPGTFNHKHSPMTFVA